MNAVLAIASAFHAVALVWRVSTVSMILNSMPCLNSVTGHARHDNDEHYMRDLTFREKTSIPHITGASVDAGYYVTPNAKVFAEFTYSSYEEGKSGTQIIDTNTGESGLYWRRCLPVFQTATIPLLRVCNTASDPAVVNQDRN